MPKKFMKLKVNWCKNLYVIQAMIPHQHNVKKESKWSYQRVCQWMVLTMDLDHNINAIDIFLIDLHAFSFRLMSTCCLHIKAAIRGKAKNSVIPLLSCVNRMMMQISLSVKYWQMRILFLSLIFISQRTFGFGFLNDLPFHFLYDGLFWWVVRSHHSSYLWVWVVSTQVVSRWQGHLNLNCYNHIYLNFSHWRGGWNAKALLSHSRTISCIKESPSETHNLTFVTNR